jgi:CheY-like chemotaxis protein
MVSIVLIDDDAVSSFVTEKFIQKNINQPCKIFKFTSASEALREIYSIKPRYLFLDLIMPQMTGWDFLDRLEERTMDTEIYILSSSLDELDLQKVSYCEKVRKFLPKQTVKRSIEDIFKS